METSRRNRELEKKLQTQQATINNGQVSQQVGQAIVKDIANLAVTNHNTALRELLKKHGITINSSGSSSHEN